MMSCCHGCSKIIKIYSDESHFSTQWNFYKRNYKITFFHSVEICAKNKHVFPLSGILCKNAHFSTQWNFYFFKIISRKKNSLKVYHNINKKYKKEKMLYDKQ